jgi:hypothetical protein
MRKSLVRAVKWHGIVTFSMLLASNAWSYTGAECICCHEKGSRESKLQIDIDRYRSSVHGKEMGCSDCHQNIRDDKHITMKGSGRVSCQQCHEQENLHSKDRSVVCASCHTRHSIYGVEDRRSSVHRENLEYTCGTCHPAQTGNPSKLSFLPSLQIVSHPKQSFSETFDKGMCVGCHQGKAAHGEDTPVNSQECYTCHAPLAKNRVVLGYIHTNATWQSQPINAVAAYICLIGLAVLIFILFNVLRGFVGKRR